MTIDIIYHINELNFIYYNYINNAKKKYQTA